MTFLEPVRNTGNPPPTPSSASARHATENVIDLTHEEAERFVAGER